MCTLPAGPLQLQTVLSATVPVSIPQQSAHDCTYSQSPGLLRWLWMSTQVIDVIAITCKLTCCHSWSSEESGLLWLSTIVSELGKACWQGCGLAGNENTKDIGWGAEALFVYLVRIVTCISFLCLLTCFITLVGGIKGKVISLKDKWKYGGTYAPCHN